MADSSAAAVAHTAVVPRPETKKRRKARRQPRYHVVLWDSDQHTYAYVIRMLAELFHYEVERGYQLACEVDTRGRAIVLTTTREHAELKRDQILAYGRDGLISGCRGSMYATIEPAAEDP